MQELLDTLHYDYVVKAIPIAGKIPVQFVYIGGLLAASVLIIVWMSLVAMGWIWAERRVSGRMQARIGPNRVHLYPDYFHPNNVLKGANVLVRGLLYIPALLVWMLVVVIDKIMPTGFLQSLADGVKLLTKEDIIPASANRFLYELAPLLVFAGAFIPFVALPFSQHLVIADMDLGVFYILAFGALEVVGILMAGWGPNSKWTLYGGMRLAAQMLSYEIPLGLSILVVVILAGSLNMTDIILWQTQGILFWDNVNVIWPFNIVSWAVFRNPILGIVAFVIFYVAALAESKRAPFDLPEAESELVAGFHTEYTGIRFSYFFLAEYCAMYVMCLLGAAIFLGGWSWPLPAAYTPPSWFPDGGFGVFLNELFGFINIVSKSFVLLFVMLWVRWTLPRVRIDQVMHLCLKVLLPFSLACVLLAAIQGAFTVVDEDSLVNQRKAERMTPRVPRVYVPPVEEPAETAAEEAESEPAPAATPAPTPAAPARPTPEPEWVGEEFTEEEEADFVN